MWPSGRHPREAGKTPEETGCAREPGGRIGNNLSERRTPQRPGCHAKTPAGDGGGIRFLTLPCTRKLFSQTLADIGSIRKHRHPYGPKTGVLRQFKNIIDIGRFARQTCVSLLRCIPCLPALSPSYVFHFQVCAQVPKGQTDSELFCDSGRKDRLAL